MSLYFVLVFCFLVVLVLVSLILYVLTGCGWPHIHITCNLVYDANTTILCNIMILNNIVTPLWASLSLSIVLVDLAKVSQFHFVHLASTCSSSHYSVVSYYLHSRPFQPFGIKARGSFLLPFVISLITNTHVLTIEDFKISKSTLNKFSRFLSNKNLPTSNSQDSIPW